MNKFSKSQVGFTAFETIFAIVIVALIGTVGLLLYKNHHSSTTSNSASSTNQYADWKTYCSPYEKSCFKYPDNWKFTACTTLSCQSVDNIAVTSPSGSQIGFTSGVDGRGGDCVNNIDSFITSVEPLPNVKGLYLVQFSRADVPYLGLGVDDTMPKLGDTGSCFEYTQFATKHFPNSQAYLGGDVPNSAKAKDLNTAIHIIKSYYYE